MGLARLEKARTVVRRRQVKLELSPSQLGELRARD